MSPFEKIEREYERRNVAEPFLYYLRLYAVHGFVFSRPDFFVMARPVPRFAAHCRILDDNERFIGEKKDCWFVHSAAGNTARMWQAVPFELPWFCWTRMHDDFSELRFYTKERIERLCPPDMSAFNKEPELVLANG